MKTTSIRRAFSLALIILFSTITLPAQLPATVVDDPEQDFLYKLRGVLIEMKDGRSHTGYVGWAEWLFAKETAAHFPQVLIDPALHGGNLPEQLALLFEVHQAVAPVAESLGLSKLLVTDKADWSNFPTDQIARITPYPLAYDGYNVDLVYFDLSPSSIALLTEVTPYATFNDDPANILLVSYNDRIAAHELRQLSWQLTQLLLAQSEQDFATVRAKAKRQLERQRVVMIELHSGC